MSTSIKELSLKKDPAVDEALAFLVQADEVIKVLAKNRKPEPVLDDELLINKITKMTTTGVIASASFMFSSVPLTALADMGIGPFIGMVAVSGVGLFSSIITGQLTTDSIAAGDRSRAKKYFPRTYNKIEADMEVEQRLFALTEKEYTKKENKLIKRIKPALDVVNASLDGDKLFYSSTLGNEGIKLLKKVEPTLTQWDYVSSKVEAKVAQKSLESAIPEEKTLLCQCTDH